MSALAFAAYCFTKKWTSAQWISAAVCCSGYPYIYIYTHITKFHHELSRLPQPGRAGAVQWAAFYSDCLHTVEKVTSGCRVRATKSCTLNPEPWTPNPKPRTPTLNPKHRSLTSPPKIHRQVTIAYAILARKGHPCPAAPLGSCAADKLTHAGWPPATAPLLHAVSSESMPRLIEVDLPHGGLRPLNPSQLAPRK